MDIEFNMEWVTQDFFTKELNFEIKDIIMKNQREILPHL